LQVSIIIYTFVSELQCKDKQENCCLQEKQQ